MDHEILFVKAPYIFLSDGLHSFFSISGLALLNEPSLLPIHPALNISQRAASRLHQS